MTDHANDRRRARIFHHIGRLERALINDEILLSTLRHSVNHLIGRVTVNRDDINKEIQALRDLITEDNRRDQEAVDQLNSAITDLRTQIQTLQDSGSAVESTDLDDIFTQLESLKTLIQPVDASSGVANRTTTDASGESPVAGVTDGGTPINLPDVPLPEPGNEPATEGTTDRGSANFGNSGA